MSYYNKKTIVYLDGEFKSLKNIEVNPFSQTVHYGLGAFDGIRSYQTDNGIKLFKARQHFERLKSTCKKLHLPFQWDIKHLIEDAYRLLEKNSLGNAYIRPIVYCGPNMSLSKPTEVHIMLMAWEWDSYFGDKLLKTCISEYQKPDAKSCLVEHKITGNYVNSTLAAIIAKEQGFDEALLLDSQGFVAQSPGANLFIEENGKLYTPPTGNIFPGITRQTIMTICSILEIDVEEKHFTAKQLKNADGAFLCGTATEIIGIESVDDFSFEIPFQDTIGAILKRAYRSLVMDKNNYEVLI